jgi:hypothetical protein
MPPVPPIRVELWSQILPVAQAAILAVIQQYEQAGLGTSRECHQFLLYSLTVPESRQKSKSPRSGRAVM